MTKSDVETANAIGGVVRDAVIAHLGVERSGRSASMNPSLEYLELQIVEKFKELGWERKA